MGVSMVGRRTRLLAGFSMAKRRNSNSFLGGSGQVLVGTASDGH